MVCFPHFAPSEHLNGNLKIKQSLEYQRFNTTFAVGEPVHFTVNLTDQFRNEPPSFTFYWYNGTEFIRQTLEPNYAPTFYEPGVLKLETTAIAEFVDPTQKDKDQNFKEEITLKGESC
jgi:hypothetical protein